MVEEVERPFKGRLAVRGRLRPQGAAPATSRCATRTASSSGSRDLRGKVVVLSPTYTTCEDTCPIVAQQIRGALDDLSEASAPGPRACAQRRPGQRHAGHARRSSCSTRRVRGYLDFLLGTRRELQPVWREYGFAPQTDTQEHNSYVVLLDGEGRQRVGLPGRTSSRPEALAHDLRLLVREAQRS